MEGDRGSVVGGSWRVCWEGTRGNLGLLFDTHINVSHIRTCAR